MRARVAVVLDAPDAVLIALRHVHDDVGRVAVALLELGVDVGLDEAGVLVRVGDLLDAVGDDLGAQPAAAVPPEGAQQLLVGVGLVALDRDVAELEALPLVHRHGQEQPPLLVLRRRGALVQRLDLDLRVGDHRVLVALAAVQVAHLVEVFARRRRVVDVVLEEPRHHVALRRLLHRPAQPPVAEHGVALERDLLDPHAVALVHRVGDALLARRDLLQAVLDLGEAVPLLVVHVLERHLETGQLAEVDGLALVHPDVVLDDAVADVGVADPLQPLVHHRAQHGALLQLDLELHPAGLGQGLDLDVVDQVAAPEVVQVGVQPPLVERLADLQPEIEQQAVLGQRVQALDLDRLDDRPRSRLPLVGRLRVLRARRRRPGESDGDGGDYDRRGDAP